MNLTPSPFREVHPDLSSGGRGEANQYQEHVKQQAEAKAIRKQVIADAEETIKNIQQAKTTKNKHLNRAQRRELERQAKAAKKQYPKAA